MFAEFILEQSGGADEPIDRRVFEIVDGRLVEFVAAHDRVAVRVDPIDAARSRRSPWTGPTALNALTVPMKLELLRGARADRRRPSRPGGRPDRRRPGVLCRPGPRGARASRTRRRSTSRCASATTRSSARCGPWTSRSSRRSTAWPPGPARRSRSRATCGSRPRARGSCWRSGGSGSCRTAARRGSCPGSSGRPGRPSMALVGDPVDAADALRIGLVSKVVPAGSPPRRGPGRRRQGRRSVRRGPWLSRSTPWIARGRSTWTTRSTTRPTAGRGRCDGRPRRGPGRLPRKAAAALHRDDPRPSRSLVARDGLGLRRARAE